MATGAIGLVLGLGGMVLSSLMAPKQKTKWNFGPRVSDLNVPSVNPGNTIQYVWGEMKVPGQFIYCQRLQETTWIITTYISSDNISSLFGGGKKPVYNVKFTYSSSMALAWCKGPIVQVNRIWANGKLMWVNPDISQAEIQAEFDACYYSEQSRLISLGVDATAASCSAYIFAMNNYVNPENVAWGTIISATQYITSHPPTPLGNFNAGAVGGEIIQLFDPIVWDIFYTPTMVRYGSITNYVGDENQEPDPTLQSFAGSQAADVPAYRGIAYTVIGQLQLGGFGNTIPTFQAEILERNGQVRIVDIISDLMTLSGLSGDGQANPYGSMDNTLVVDGYAITQAVATRQVLQDMQNVFPFYANEQNYQLTFHKMFSRPVAVIRREDLASHQRGEDFPSPEDLKRAPDTDLPRRLNLKYQEKARNFSMNTVWAERFSGPSFTVEDMDITFALERQQAQNQVEEMLAYRYLNRVSVKVIVPMKYIILDPGDIVYIPNKYDPTVRDMWRIMSMTVGANGLIEMEMNHFEYISEVQSMVSVDLPEIAQAPTINASTKTWPFMMDCPMLNDVDGGRSPGFYVVLSGSAVGWGGGSLYVDTSNAGAVPAFDGMLPPDQPGTNFALLVSASVEVAQGKVVTPLAAGCIPGVWDYKSKLYVLLRDTSLVLNSVDKTTMLTTPQNVFMCGKEVIAFCNATNLGNGNWELDTIMRGMFGTEQFMNSHVAAEDFVSLQTAQRISHEASYLNDTNDYIALTSGEAFSNESPFNFTDTGVSLMPRAPWIGTCYKTPDSGHFDFILNWQPRNRQNGSWANGSDITLDQDTEAYVVNVNVGGTVKTYDLGAVRTWTYTAAMQTTDFGGPEDHPLFTIYQVGAIIGNGFGSTIQF